MKRRLPSQVGEWINRQESITFEFEGVTYEGYAGDTITSALLANGVKIIGRSFKYHRPRSVLSMANHDVNALFQLQYQGRSVPNVRGDITQIKSGYLLRAVNTFGGLTRDKARILNSLSTFLPVGFYYKAFHHKKWFPMWERLFRRLTGLGQVDVNAKTAPSAKRYGFCDVLVIGAGISGLQAALASAQAGWHVALVDEHPMLGGSALWGGDDPAGEQRMVAELLQRVRDTPHIKVYTSSFACGYYADHWVPIVTPSYIVKMRARSVIVATGAYEQPAIFRNNDLPGVMLASAAQRLLHAYAVKPCERAVILAANQDAYFAARDLAQAGVEIVAIIDLRHDIPADSLSPILRSVPHFQGHAVVEAMADERGCLQSVSVAPIDRNQQWQATAIRQWPCDGLLMSVGWAPALPLLYQAGVKMQFDDQLQQFIPTTLPPGIFACGRVQGVYGFGAKYQDGQRAAHMATAYLQGQPIVPPKVISHMASPSHPYPIFDHPKGKNFVDFDEDLQLKDFYDAAQEGFDNIELMKRFSTVGMGPSQGKHANMNVIRILAKIRGEPVEKVGTTTARPMFHPVPMGHLAGRSFQAERRTPLHSRHAQLDAVWMPAGQWLRPEYYWQADKNRMQCIADEVLTVRQRVGLIDVGTLGKIDLYGPDAATFIERVYAGRFAKLAIGMTRYGLMLDEAGIIIDDGVIARLSEDHFYFTTTTSGSATVYRELTRLNTQWGLDVAIVNLTGHFAAMNLAGPLAAQVLEPLTDLDLSHEITPFLAAREGKIAGITARILRVGFVGEMGYELHVPYEQAGAVWDALVWAGTPYGLKPFGVEAQRILRLEKGHIILGQDTDGLTHPLQVGMQWAIKMDKSFFVGKRSLQILAKQPLKQTLVGFVLVDAESPLPKECHLVIHQGEIAGRVTSIAMSPTLGYGIGLALMDPALAVLTHPFYIRADNGQLVAAKVVALPFYDPAGERQKLLITSPNLLEPVLERGG